MKKTYYSPNTIIVNIKANALLAHVSNTQAAEGATVLSRGGRGNNDGGSIWDDEEDE